MKDYHFPSVEDFPLDHQLPDPFKGPDGRRIASPAEWPRQREYLLGMMDFYMYGTMPPAPSEVAGTITSSEVRYGGAAVQEEILLRCDGFSFRMTVVRPNKPGRFPAVCHATMFPYSSGSPAEWETPCEREYVLARYESSVIAFDRAAGGGPLYDAYPGWKGKAMMAWTWGIMRMNDYLLSRDYIDPGKLAVAGCSRFGKMALCAAIHDERIALAGISGSGCGGAPPFRILGTRNGPMQDTTKIETLGRVMYDYPHWFCERMLPFGTVQTPYPVINEYRLPFDMHFARALLAPRPMITTNALADDWGNLYGDYVTWLAAQEVYEFLGAGDKTAYFYREGIHNWEKSEWMAILDFADRQFFGKERQGLASFNKPLYGDVRHHFGWKRP